MNYITSVFVKILKETLELLWLTLFLCGLCGSGMSHWAIWIAFFIEWEIVQQENQLTGLLALRYSIGDIWERAALQWLSNFHLLYPYDAFRFWNCMHCIISFYPWNSLPRIRYHYPAILNSLSLHSAAQTKIPLGVISDMFLSPHFISLHHQVLFLPPSRVNRV